MPNTNDGDKRTAILEATLDLIAEQGFHGTPMSQIAKRSGVSAGIIYHYFENKEYLIRELYHWVKGRYAEALIAGDALALPYPQHLHRMWRNAYDYFVAHPKEALFLDQYENSPYQQDWGSEPNWVLITERIGDDLQRGELPSMPLEVLYDMTIGVARSLARRRIAGQVTLDDTMLDRIADACCRNMAAAF